MRPVCRPIKYNKNKENFNLPSTQTILNYANFPLVEQQYRDEGVSSLQQYREFGENMVGQIREDVTELADQYATSLREDAIQMGTEYLNTARDQLCSDVEPKCSAFINPVFDATDRTCNGVYTELDSICTQIGQDAYDWGTDQTLFPSRLKAPMRDLIVNRCRSVIPSSATMCGWTTPLRETATSTCRTELRDGLGCE